ncbi:MlaA family lipoprotein [Pelagibius marinus]|uniref:MlaA family lipoprotein n=1 Tax=Pelagibius marinus TaxID=2762760 RepID=UPI001872DF82|nr:VacJ family lipoprotein [Pelagibius marinus]
MSSSLAQSLRSVCAVVAVSFVLSACAGTPQTGAPQSEARAGDPQSTQIAQSDTGQSDGGDAWSDSETDNFGPEPDYNDPLEVPNRMFFAFNEAIDFMVIRPVAVTYRFIVPTGVRNSVRNFLRNLRTPVTLANDLLQGDLERAEATFARFLINSTIGLLGLFDIAADSGYPYHDEDFGQTLGTYGAGEGFYLVLPILGPSSLRDGTGRIVDIFLDPLTYLAPREFGLGRAVATGVDFRARNIEELDALEADSLDFYARIRSLYRQNRVNEINNGAPTGEVPNFSEVPPVAPSGVPGPSTSAVE